MASYYPEESEMEEREESPAEEKQEQEEGNTALIPKSLLMGKDFKPGDEVIFKIMHEYGDEVEIAYATGDEKKEKRKTAMDESMDDMGKMADNPGSEGGY